MINDTVVIGSYTLSDLKKIDVLVLSDKLSSLEIDNLMFINKKSNIHFINRSDVYDEKKFFNNLSNIFMELEQHNRVYNIEIDVRSRELLRESNLLDCIKNINLTINVSNCTYSLDEYLLEEKKLNDLVDSVKRANLSPFEKYLAVYNIVKKFKAYKENPDNFWDSRKLKYILDNEYMVCVGYANLLVVLLEKVGISSMVVGSSVDISYDDGFTKECICTKFCGHQRNIVKIDDDKYNIYGIYVVDATWDNNMSIDLYNHAVMTFDRMKEALRLETLEKTDLILDFHNIYDFCTGTRSGGLRKGQSPCEFLGGLSEFLSR